MITISEICKKAVISSSEGTIPVLAGGTTEIYENPQTS
jgi:hypothetical protein